MGALQYFCKMFIRKKKNSTGSISVQIVNKIGRKNKVLKTIGCSSVPEEIEKFQKQAEYDIHRLFGPTLFDSPLIPAITELSNDDIRIIGPELIFGSI